MLHRHSIQEFPGDERVAILAFNFADRADAGMLESGGGLGFALKTAEGLRVFGEFLGNKQHGNVAAPLKVFGTIDSAHAPVTDVAENATVGRRLPDGFGRPGHGENVAASEQIRGMSRANRASSDDLTNPPLCCGVVSDGRSRARAP
jgi:hypothetical protein